MKRTRQIKIVQFRYDLDKKEMRIIKRWLGGEIGSREAALQLNCSHQQVINLVSSLCQQWYQSGKLKI